MEPAPTSPEGGDAEHLRRVLAELSDLSRDVATLLLENEDLNDAIAMILAGVGQSLGLSRTLLCRYREEGRTVLHTHEWQAEESGASVHHTDPEPEPSERYAWAHAALTRGEAIRVAELDGATQPAHTGAGLLSPGERAMLVLPVFIEGQLEHLFAFVDREPREWGEGIVSILEIMVGAFARGVERRSAERRCANLARELEVAVEREKVANRYKSEFLANMSHEIRTPMNAIVGYAELLSRSNVDRRTHELWTANLRRSAGYLMRLVNDVLDLSRIEAGEMKLERSIASLGELVAGVHHMLRGVAEEKELELAVDVEGRVPAEIETDPVRFEQILVNLVGNALKYTHAGRVVVRLRWTPGEGEGGTLHADVQDTGPGISREDAAHLFQPFSQLQHTQTGSSGLGLLISRHLARLLGGDITLASEVGEGSTFTLSLPLARPSALTLERIDTRSAPAPTYAPRGELKGLRILIADDNPENREVLTFLLEEEGARCETVANGAMALDVALSAQRAGRGFHVVLMDMSMPVLDGYQATRRLVESGFDAPVIALTAFAMPGDRERSLEAGCADYLTKPIVPARLIAMLREHASTEKPAPTASRPVAGGPGAVFSLAGNPRFQRLIERYVASFGEQIEALRHAAAAGDRLALRTQAHRLRGTAANYGFPGVSEAAGACEDAIRAGRSAAEIDEALGALIDCLARAQAG